MRRTRENYYLGFDIGTNSVGWAVTDENYQLIRFNGKQMWGSRLFDEAQTAEKRRLSRTLRRRLQRRRWRIELLQELFSEEICKTDPGFYQRMKESAFLQEDKSVSQPHALFCDANYMDADFYNEYPTIYHLRKELIQSEDKKDIRLVYLAIHHIIKHRGHFLFADSVEKATSFECAYDALLQCMRDEFDMELVCESKDDMSEIIKDKSISKRDKSAQVLELLHCEGKEKQKQLKAIVGLICGSKCQLSDVFCDNTLKETERPSISFAESSYDEVRPELEEVLQERCGILDIIKGVYDWGILADILQGGEYEGKSYLSFAKVKMYEKHQRDLQKLKELIRTYVKNDYKDFFQKPGVDNYCAYVGSTQNNGKKQSVKRCTYETFAKAIKKILVKIAHPDAEKSIKDIQGELDAGTFLPLQVSKDNGVIPYQVHEMELKAILEHASKHYAFLNEKDERGYTICDKIIKLFKFRIPYYVGPLNTAKGKNSWMVRKATGPILPWNFDDIVDENRSAEEFIRRMTNKCTYLVGEDVLPKNSLLYSEFMVWNELNNLRVKGELLSVDIKSKVFSEVFQRKKRVTPKAVIDFLRSEGMRVESDELSGIDQTFKSSLGSYLDMKKIFGEEMKKQSIQEMAENLILWITLYGEAPKMLKQVIRSHYDSNQISEEQIKKVCRLKYQGWGRLSREFLNGVEGTSTETGEVFHVIHALRDTNDNLMQLLSSKYTFTEEINKYNREKASDLPTNFCYEKVMEDFVASPAIKRAAWQVILIAEEVRKIMGKQPEKIFVEMARGPEEKKRTESRKDRLLKLYSKIKEESRDWKAELENRPESDFRSIKLYLYYTQMGKCMYSGESIDISRLAETTVYDRDHIYPQSKTKDDSIDNLVLVKRELNAKKSDDVLSAEIQEKMEGFWRGLRDNGLISKEKYRRLTRKTPLTDEELAGFINRQLVETRQSSKVVAELFQRIYEHSKVVYVKAKAVADFRNETLMMVKCRSLNDYHHAKDAYLNIVVGNVYHEKFTSNPLQWLKRNPAKNYSLNQMFNHDICINGRMIWKRGEEGTLKTIRKQLKSKNIRYTRYATENKCGQNGGFFDSQIVSKSSNATVPIKKGLDVNKYGGYKTVTPAYFALVASEDKKGNPQKSIEAVPLYLKEAIEKDSKVFLEYCEDVYGLRNPRILLPRIKKDSYFIINGFPMHLRGRSNNQLVFQVAVQLLLSEEYEAYLKKIEKYIARNQSNNGKELLQITDKDGLSQEQNIMMYDELYRKQKETIYRYRPASQLKILESGRDLFEELSCEKQCLVINEILNLLRCKPIAAKLTAIKGSANAGKIQISKMVSNCSQVKLINQSVTGLFEQEIDLLAL